MTIRERRMIRRDYAGEIQDKLHGLPQKFLTELMTYTSNLESQAMFVALDDLVQARFSSLVSTPQGIAALGAYCEFCESSPSDPEFYRNYRTAILKLEGEIFSATDKLTRSPRRDRLEYDFRPRSRCRIRRPMDLDDLDDLEFDHPRR